MPRLTEQVHHHNRRKHALSLKRRALKRHDIGAAAELSRMVMRREIDAGEVGLTHDEAMRFPFSALRGAP